MSEEKGVAKGLFLGFLAGGIVGSVLALLYAPKSGKELRQDIKNKKEEILDDAEEYLDIAKHKAQDIINEGKKRSEEFKKLNPTAENIAIVIYKLLRPHLDKKLDLQIRLYETPRNFVEYPVKDPIHFKN